MNNSSDIFPGPPPPSMSVLALPPSLAYPIIAVYLTVILLASFGSVLVIVAVVRTRSNVYIGKKILLLLIIDMFILCCQVTWLYLTCAWCCWPAPPPCCRCLS